jgi:diaminopimelate decarboxylase
LQELDLGGGWGVAYTEHQESLAIDTIAHRITDALARAADDHAKTDHLRLLVEPGRALVGQAAVAVYTVGAVKRIPGVRTYVSVDGGMGDNIRPALYSARYTAWVANKMETGPGGDAPMERVAIAGRYCEQGDVLIEEVPLPPVVPGDLIVIPVAGAYHLAMASNYNAIPRPVVLAARDGTARVIRRRETFDDLLRCEADA